MPRAGTNPELRKSKLARSILATLAGEKTADPTPKELASQLVASAGGPSELAKTAWLVFSNAKSDAVKANLLKSILALCASAYSKVKEEDFSSLSDTDLRAVVKQMVGSFSEKESDDVAAADVPGHPEPAPDSGS